MPATTVCIAGKAQRVLLEGTIMTDNNRKTRTISFRVSEDEWQLMEQAVSTTTTTPHDWCRETILNALKQDHGLSRNERLIYDEVARGYYLLTNAFSLIAQNKMDQEAWQTVIAKASKEGATINAELLLRRISDDLKRESK